MPETEQYRIYFRFEDGVVLQHQELWHLWQQLEIGHINVFLHNTKGFFFQKNTCERDSQEGKKIQVANPDCSSIGCIGLTSRTD